MNEEQRLKIQISILEIDVKNIKKKILKNQIELGDKMRELNAKRKELKKL